MSFVVYIAHERIEVAVGLAVLVGEVYCPVAAAVAYASRDAVRGFPVGIVCRRAIVSAVRIDGAVLTRPCYTSAIRSYIQDVQPSCAPA